MRGEEIMKLFVKITEEMRDSNLTKDEERMILKFLEIYVNETETSSGTLTTVYTGGKDII